MLRRSFLSLIAALLIPTGLMAASNPLADAFAALTAEQRQTVLAEIQTGGLYDGPLDAGPSDEITTALQMTAETVFANGYEGPTIDITTPAGATAFLAAIVSGDMAKWIYGEGDEMDG